jgi:glycosyltransferase involved in cell wall biosynthesis
VSQYPAANHTFILREIRGLRDLGFDIRVASVRSCDRPVERLTAIERDELGRTFFIKPAGLAGFIGAFLRQPGGCLAGLVYALSLAGLDLRKAARHLLYFAEAAIFAAWMRRERLQHVHTHFSSLVALIAQRITPMTLSMTLHGPDEFIDPVGFFLGEKVAASRFVCAISQYGRSQILKNCKFPDWDKVKVARLGVDPAIFTIAPFRERPEVFQLLTVGRLAPAKAQHVLIAVVDQLLKQGMRVQLRLAGDGPDRASLQQEVQRRGLGASVVFEGTVNQDRVLELYRQCDVFVMSSFAEGIPVVLMEAMSMEIPCVATWITGIPELIRDGVDGLLAPPGDVDALVLAIGRLMQDPGLRRQLGQAGRLRVDEEFNLGKNVKALAALFQ